MGSQFPPKCEQCGQILKPDVVFFGEPIPEPAMQTAVQHIECAKFLLVVGTSAVVAPASYIPTMARQAGAVVVEINLEPSILTGKYADYTLLGKAGKLLPILVNEIEYVL